MSFKRPSTTQSTFQNDSTHTHTNNRKKSTEKNMFRSSIQRIWNPLSLHIKLGHFQADSFSHRRNAVWRWRDALDCSILQWKKNKNNTQQATNQLVVVVVVGSCELLKCLKPSHACWYGVTFLFFSYGWKKIEHGKVANK